MSKKYMFKGTADNLWKFCKFCSGAYRVNVDTNVCESCENHPSLLYRAYGPGKFRFVNIHMHMSEWGSYKDVYLDIAINGFSMITLVSGDKEFQYMILRVENDLDGIWIGYHDNMLVKFDGKDGPYLERVICEVWMV